MIKYCNFILSLILISIIFGCGKSGTNSELIESELPINEDLADYEMLFIGNSHSSSNGLPNLVSILIEAGVPDKTANAELAPGWNFLDERLNDGVTNSTLKARAWTHVFLQAQKYSTTGQYYYETSSAVEWVRRVKAQNALPIMFPEWPRRSNTEEGHRVYGLHLSIAAEEPACVAPVGPVWDEFILRYPTIALHASDGNHSNLTGALLTAYVFYQIVTGNNANELSYIPEINVADGVQQKLKEVASVFHGVHLPCP